MKGYWIALYNQIEDQGNLSKYAEAATKAILNHGGKPLVRGGDYQCLEGADFPRTVIWEFPSYEKALECYHSEAYQEAWSYAKETTNRNLQICKQFNS
jgi:uncharacterized protein (DUF1330 family)